MQMQIQIQMEIPMQLPHMEIEVQMERGKWESGAGGEKGNAIYVKGEASRV